MKRAYWIQLAIFASMLAFSLYMSSKMPDIVPTHWGLNGKPDAYGSKWTNLLIMPIMLPFMTLLCYVLPLISPKSFAIERFRDTWDYVMLILSAMFAGLHIVIVQASVNHSFDMTRAMMLIFSLFTILMGNVLGRVKQNFFMGIRTPWTLASEKVWTATHRSAGRLWMGAGILCMIACALDVNVAITFTVFILVMLYPVPQSYFIYRRLEGDGKPVSG